MKNRVFFLSVGSIFFIGIFSALTVFAQSSFNSMFNGYQQRAQDANEQGILKKSVVSQQKVKQKSSKNTKEVCSQTSLPVCGKDGITYLNACQAQAKKASIAYNGKCSKNGKTKENLFQQTQNIFGSQKKSKSKSTSSSITQQSFHIGPGPDRDVFYLSTSGEGDLITTLTWTGSAQGLQLEIGPKIVPDKKTTGTVGRKIQKHRPIVRASLINTYQSNPQTTEDIIENTTEELQDELNASFYVTQQQGTSPLSVTLEIDETSPSDLMVTIQSFDGEADVSLSFSGDVVVLSATKQEVETQLNATGKIIVPLVMYQLDRYFKNPTKKTSLDTKFASHLSQFPLAQNKLKIALNRYTALPLLKKQTLFNNTVVSILESAQGQALSKKKISDIQNLLRSELPPLTPKDFTGSVTLTDPDASSGGKLLTLQWKHPGSFTTKYVIERAPAQIIEQILNLTELQFTNYKEVNKPKKGRGGKYILQKIQELVSYEDYPNLYCYRVRAWNNKGFSDYTNVMCPELTGVSTVSHKFNVKWTHLHAIEESDYDGLSDSDEPYVLFTMINGKNEDGTPKTWVRKWDASDDVDSGETEPDNGRANFTLFGEPPIEATQDLENFKNQLLDTPQYLFQNGVYTVNPAYTQILDEIRNHEWGSKHTFNYDMPSDIDLYTGFIIATTVMEEDAGAHITLEEQIKAGIQAAQDIAEAFMDPSGVSIAFAVKSTLEFMYNMWANDDLVGTTTWHVTASDANSLIYPPQSTGAYLKELDVNGGGSGHYTVGMCLYRENTNVYTIQQGCGITSGQ